MTSKRNLKSLLVLGLLTFNTTFTGAQEVTHGTGLGEIRVPLEQVRHLGHGEVVVVLFKKIGRVEMQMNRAFRVQKLLAASHRMTAIFTQIPYGTYAVGVFHDLNGNGKLDTNWIGFPKEDMAVSNNAKGGPLGGPLWQKTKVVLARPFLKVDVIKIHPFGPDRID